MTKTNFEDMRVFGPVSQLTHKTLTLDSSQKSEWPPHLVKSLQEDSLNVCGGLGRFHHRFDRETKLVVLENAKDRLVRVRAALMVARGFVKQRDQEALLKELMDLADQSLGQICALSAFVFNPD